MTTAVITRYPSRKEIRVTRRDRKQAGDYADRIARILISYGKVDLVAVRFEKV